MMTGDSVDWSCTLSVALGMLREEGSFCDTTVVGNDQKTFRAHACILAAASPTLKTYLKQAAGSTYIVRVDHMSSSTWQGVLHFVYTGQVDATSESSVTSLSKAANTLQIVGLQTALASKTKVETAMMEKPVAGVKDEEEPAAAASQLHEEDRDAETLSLADDDKCVARRVTGQKTVVKRERIRRRQTRAHSNSKLERVTKGDVRTEQDSGTAQTGVSEVNTSATALDDDAESEHKCVDGAEETEHANGGIVRSEHKHSDSATETEGTKEATKSARGVNAKAACLCNVCGKVLAPGSLTRHMYIHDDGEKPYQCDTCHVGFAVLHALRKHSRIHTGEKPYRCHVCGKTFSSSATLPYHMKIHTGEKPYVCDICECAFRSLNAMKVHRRTHTGEKPFTCSVCGKSFVTANRRNRHAWMHDGRKPYHCDFCDKTYTSSTKLKVHRRIHTGEKPFMCELCGQLFSRQTSLKTHVAGHNKLLQRGLCAQSLDQQKVRLVILDAAQ